MTDQTFLFADLAGFTTLTEALGDQVAAETASAFCRELNALLPDGAEDLKSLGDACMLRVPDAAEAIDLAIALVRDVAGDRPFPHVRVGMHTGTAVFHHDDWFGRTVNVAARVAALAAPGEVLLTSTTLAAAGPRPPGVEDRGIQTLRHVRDPVRLWSAAHELDPVDPTCRLRLRGSGPFVDAGSNRFCSAGCAENFRGSPTLDRC